MEILSLEEENIIKDIRNLFRLEKETKAIKDQVGIYMFKANNRTTRTRCEICSKLTIKTPERHMALFWCLHC